MSTAAGRGPAGRASSMPHDSLRAAMADLVQELQEDLCAELERLDGAGRFSRDAWERPGGGGGLARVLEGGALLEKAGVNVSEVHGQLDPAFAGTLGGEGTAFAAVGLSAVLHPLSPMVPTAHLNVRLVARGRKAWFGGGADLTPCYLFEEDAAHFHRALKAACDRLDRSWYPRFKKACDDYFYLPHRGEHRGVGGIFFEDPDPDLELGLALCGEVARAFLPAWAPIAGRRRALPFGDRERAWQEIRRGRYVEFNLLHDRGTVFGLRTGGRAESVLMSLPPRVRWAYDHRPEPGSPEERLLLELRATRDWA